MDPSKPPEAAPLLIAVVTGGHRFDTIEFAELFQSIPGIRPIVQHLDDWCASSSAVRASYDVVLFYTMMLPGPTDEGLPWYAGKQVAALSELGQTKQGIFILHHALVAFPKWKPWSDMIGTADRTSTAHWSGGPVTTDVADPTHPITRGLPPSWTMNDESYVQNDPAGPDVQVLLTTCHQPSMRSIAWTNRYHHSRVFCYQSGHGTPVYADPHFREIVARGIRWVACR